MQGGGGVWGWGEALEDVNLPCVRVFKFTCDAQQCSTQRHPSTYPCLLQEYEHVIWGKSFVDMWIPVNYIV